MGAIAMTKGLVKTNETVTAMKKEFKKEQTDVEGKVTALGRRESKYVTHQEMCRYVVVTGFIGPGDVYAPLNGQPMRLLLVSRDLA
jgi:hypothetical protein